jgi:hypothetical protein
MSLARLSKGYEKGYEKESSSILIMDFGRAEVNGPGPILLTHINSARSIFK